MNKPNYLDVPTDFPPDFASAYGQDSKGHWLELSFYNERVCFRWIPNGKFTMGSDKNEKGRIVTEHQHPVILSKGFWLAETTVTQALWKAVMDENPSHFQQDNTTYFPVESVSLVDVHGFIAKLNQLHSDIKVRLPWEAEWEYACRAGTETPFNFAGDLTLDKVNYRGTWDDYEKWGKGAKKTTVAVKSYLSNAWGLYEMHGNVWEWCEDNWEPYLGTEEVTDPWLSVEKKQADPEAGCFRLVRGGSWRLYGSSTRSAARDWLSPRIGVDSLGFRLSLVF
jgi:formylglycine-generating enzyme required for sulfatase activity